MEEIAAVDALVNTGAGAQVDRRGLLRINDQRENIGIVDDSVLNLMPVVSAILGLPGKMPCAGINHIRILRIDG